jgi:S1-C subfamily serine protease
MLLTLAFLIATRAEPHLASCAWVRAENDGAGGGFVVDVEKRLLVTCRHVVADRKKVDVFFPWVRNGELVTNRSEYLGNRPLLRERGLLVTGTVLKTSDETDLALVQVDSLPAGTRAVTLSCRALIPGERLRAVGHRLDLDTVWNVTVGPIRTLGALADGYFWRGKKLAVGADVVIGQLPIEEGDSGGPVFDSRGACVGAVCALRRQCPLAAVVVSATEVRRLIGTADVVTKNDRLLPIAEALVRATVWVKPTATDSSAAGALIEPDLVLTAARGLSAGERVGVALPVRIGDRWVSERAAYRDPLTLHLRSAWRAGTVIARDPARDLALIRLDAGAEQMKPVPLAAACPEPGAELHSMSHPGGLEFAWVYASGAVRQRGKVALEPGEQAQRVSVLVLQLPAQTGSHGGPVLNANGELVGVLAAREGAQMVGYAADPDEVRAFLEKAIPARAAKTLAGLLARAEELPTRWASSLARGLADRAEVHRAAGRSAEANRDCDWALVLDSTCTIARLIRARMLPDEEARAELDTAIEKGPFHRSALLLRAELAVRSKDCRTARGDLERILAVFPADADVRLRLAGAYLGLGDDAKAALAVRDTLRADPKRLPAVAVELLAQAEALEQKFPDAPHIPADWLARALAAAEKGAAEPDAAAIARVLKSAAAAKGDLERLRVLRTALKTLR